MTFSIVGRCPETGQLGIAISSSSIAVGARCPWLRAGVGAVATQNVTLPALGPQILDLLEQQALEPGDALQRALGANGWSQYRQVTVIDSQGRTALFSGKEALGLYNAVAGEQCVAAGNLLASEAVIQAMVEAFENASGQLADRLLAAMHGRWPLAVRPARCTRRRSRWWVIWSGRSSTCGSTGRMTTPSPSSTACGRPTARRCRIT